MPEKYRKNSNLIKGCQSRVWGGTEMDDGKLIIHADSDSLITKGLIALFIRLLSGLTPAEILAADMSKLDGCGLKEHLASTRANALTSMAATIRKAADAAAKTFLL
jgi:cysteine desulfuration protein SufE